MGDRSTSAGEASPPVCAATLDRRCTRRRRAETRFDRCVAARQGRGDVPLLSVSSGRPMRPHRPALPPASDGPAWSRNRNPLRAPRTIARMPPAGADLGPDPINACVVSGAAGPLATAREPDAAVGVGQGHGRSGSQGGAGSAGWRESPRLERGGRGDDPSAPPCQPDHIMTVTLPRGGGSPTVPKVQSHHQTGR
jgi:hypothetical protein